MVCHLLMSLEYHVLELGVISALQDQGLPAHIAPARLPSTVETPFHSWIHQVEHLDGKKQPRLSNGLVEELPKKA